MSIKTIDTISVGTDTGISKKINKGAEKLVFDILQSTQYSTPIPSTVRELVTNACDSQREKEIAVEILTGLKRVEDYYIERHGDQYEDSNFNKEYYDLESFSDKNRVSIVYKRNEGVGYCDTFSITDHGVGIGDRRLEGVLELGYSTKRNTSQNFGAFGLGAKVALSTGVEYYTIETVYQGKRFKVNCYSYKTEFVIPKFNLLTGEINPAYTLSDGSVIYYEPTTEKNFTTVSFGVKKHNYSRFKDAVSEQLTYFDNVDFKVIHEDGIEDPINFRTPILYNSDTLIVSESYYFNKPHIVIVKDVKSNNGINYGHIDFKELEMEQLYGAIGLKCPIRQSYVDENGEVVVIQDGVEVTPSREKVIWNDATKNYIQTVIGKASDEVTNIVESELKETDFIKWIVACRDVLYNATKSKNVDENKRTVLAVLSNIIDTTNLKPKFSLNQTIKFSGMSSLFYGFKVVKKVINTNINSSSKSKSISIVGVDIASWEKFDSTNLYIAEGSISRLKDYHLILESKEEESFTLIYPKDLDHLLEKINDPDTSEVDKAVYTQEYKKSVANQQALLPLLKSSVLYKNYDEVEVPESVSLALVKAEELTENDLRYMGINETPEERRLRNSAVVVHGIRLDGGNNKNLVWDKAEPILNTLITSESPLYYGTNENGDLLNSAFKFISSRFPSPSYLYSGISSYRDDRTISYWDTLPESSISNSSHQRKINADGTLRTVPTPQLIKISQVNLKHIQLNRHAKHIDQFYYDVKDDGTLTAHDFVRYTVTLWVCKQKTGLDFTDFEFEDTLKSLSYINPAFDSIRELISKVRIFDFNNLPVEIQKMYEKWAAFQSRCKHVTSDELEELSANLCIFSDIKSVDIYDEEMLEVLEYIVEVIKLAAPLCEHIESYSYENAKDPIEVYLKTVGVFDIPLPGNCSTLIELNTNVLQTILNSLK
jgi:hypothetical protein